MSLPVVGIDPGSTGAIAMIDPDGLLVDVWDMPLITEKSGKRHINIPELASIMRHAASRSLVKIERVSAMPGQGVTSCFNFGRNFGTILGVVQTLGLQLEQVTPQAWKKSAGLIKAPKDYSRTKAIELYPDAELHLKKHHGRADAILIARYG